MSAEAEGRRALVGSTLRDYCPATVVGLLSGRDARPSRPAYGRAVSPLYTERDARANDLAMAVGPASWRQGFRPVNSLTRAGWSPVES
jgi:hypothetical protein